MLADLTISAASLASSGCSADQGSQTVLQIRIHNESSYPMANLWLGAGPRGGATQETEFGPIGIGNSSGWKQVPAVEDNYRKLNFVINGQRYNVVVDLPEGPLPGGSYTIFRTLGDQDATATMIA